MMLQYPRKALAALLLCTAALSCGDGPTAVGVPALLEVVSGQDQTYPAGAEMPDPLVVRVLDASGSPVPGQLVNFRVVAGGGTMFAGAGITNSSGVVQDRWTLGRSVADSQRVEARAVDNQTGEPIVFAVFRAVAVAGPPAQLVRSAGDGQAAPIQAPLPESLAVRVLDQFGNPASGVTVTWSVTAPGGSIAPATSTTDATGTARARWTMGTVTGPGTATAAAAGLSVDFLATALVGPIATIIKIAGDSQTGVVNAALPVMPAVKLLDAGGNAVGGATVTFVVSEGGGQLDSTLVYTNPAGVATPGRWVLGITAGAPNKLAVVVSGLNNVEFTATAIATAPAMFLGPLNGQWAAPGTPVDSAPSVTVLDQFGNPVPNLSVDFVVTGGGGSVAGSPVTTSASGVATAGAWTLGATRGLNTLRVTVPTLPPRSISAYAGLRSPYIEFQDFQPREGSRLGDPLPLVVRVASAYSLTSVTAAIGSRVTSLSPGSNGYWNGQLTIRDLPRDTLVVMFTATDMYGAVEDAFVRIVHNERPVVTLTSPVDGFVARPMLSVSASCTDDAACTSMRMRVSGFLIGGPTLLTGVSSLGGTVSLAQFEGQRVTVYVDAFDADSDGVTVIRQGYIESNSHLVEIATVDQGTVLDVLNDRVLYVDTLATPVLAMLTISTSQVDTLLLDTAVRYYIDARLTPVGVVFADPRAARTLVEWRNGGLTTLSSDYATGTLQAAGPYVLFSSTQQVLLDVVSRAQQSFIGYWPSLAANGDAVYTDTYTGGAIYRLRGGVATRLTSPGDTLVSDHPVTDGVNVVYRKHNVAGTQSLIALHDGSVETTLLNSARVGSLVPPSDYVVNGGWTAYVGTNSQVFARSPAGVTQQVTPPLATAPPFVEALAPDGQVVYRVYTGVISSRYLAAPPYTSAPVVVGTYFGSAVWNGEFQVRIGRSVFRIVP